MSAVKILPTDIHVAKRLLRYLAAHRAQFWASLLLYPLNAVTVVVPPYLVQQIFNQAINHHNVQQLWILSGCYLLALLFEYVTGFASEYSMSLLGQRAMAKLRQDLFEHVQRLPAAFFDKNPIGRTLTRLTSDVEALSDIFTTGAVTIIGDILTAMAVVGMMLWLDVRLTAFAFLAFPPLIAAAWIVQRYARQAFRDIRRFSARINAFLVEHINNIVAVQIFNQQERTQQEFADLNSDYRNANRQAIVCDAALYSVVEAIGNIAIAVLVWYGVSSMDPGLHSTGLLVAFIQYIRRFFVPIRDLSTKYTVWQAAIAAAERIFGLFEESVESPKQSTHVALPVLQQAICFEHVWFAYHTPQSEEDYVLKDINLNIQRGERLALVGATGSGKSSILKLLNRFYEANRGTIRFDGIDIRHIALSDLRRLFAVVLQDVHLFSGTIMDNLAFSGRITQEAAMHAVQAIGAADFINRLTHGYQTPVQELGANFSAGERQLLALARALAIDPQILILDEATSNIDSETEAHIQTALDILLKNRTAVVVAHRLSTIEKVDRIIVLQQGRIVAEGSHQTLMQQDGLYQSWVTMQTSKSLHHQDHAALNLL